MSLTAQHLHRQNKPTTHLEECGHPTEAAMFLPDLQLPSHHLHFPSSGVFNMGGKTADMQLICYITYACREVEPFDALIYPYSQYLQGHLQTFCMGLFL